MTIDFESVQELSRAELVYLRVQHITVPDFDCVFAECRRMIRRVVCILVDW
jgi:hypothetical protein